MGRFTFSLPDIGEGIAEAEIVAWHVKVGDRVEEDGRLADMMTDKATVEMESPVAGTVVEVAGEVGDVIAIGSPLVVIETEGERARRGRRAGAEAAVVEERIEVETPDAERCRATLPRRRAQDERRRRRARRRAPSRLCRALAAASARRQALGTPRSSPSPPSARAPRSSASTSPRSARPRTAASAMPISTRSSSYGGAAGLRARRRRAARDETIKVVGLRRRIAENMAASKRNIPHFTYVEECDVTDARGAARRPQRQPRASGPS